MKKKLLLVVPLPPPVHGSNIMNRHIAQNRQLKEKYEVQLFPLYYASSNEDIGKRPFIKLIKSFIYYLRFLLLDFKPDIIYFVPAVTGAPFYRDFIFSLLLKLNSDKLIIHLHGKGIQEKSKNIFVRYLYRWFFKNTYIIHLSNYLLDDINGLIADSSKIYILPNGVEIPFRTTDVKHIKKNRVNILFLSNLYVAKGVFLLLDMARILKDRNLQFTIHMVGNTTREISRELLQEKIQSYGLEKHVIYHGVKYGMEKYVMLAQADIFAYPTQKDCFPLVIIEAMSFKLPVVSTDIAAIPEIVDDGLTGFVIEPNNIQLFTNKLEFLIKNAEECMKMGELAFKKYLQKYTIEKFNESVVRIINEIVE